MQPFDNNPSKNPLHSEPATVPIRPIALTPRGNIFTWSQKQISLTIFAGNPITNPFGQQISVGIPLPDSPLLFVSPAAVNEFNRVLSQIFLTPCGRLVVADKNMRLWFNPTVQYRMENNPIPNEYFPTGICPIAFNTFTIFALVKYPNYDQPMPGINPFPNVQETKKVQAVADQPAQPAGQGQQANQEIPMVMNTAQEIIEFYRTNPLLFQQLFNPQATNENQPIANDSNSTPATPAPATVSTGNNRRKRPAGTPLESDGVSPAKKSKDNDELGLCDFMCMIVAPMKSFD